MWYVFAICISICILIRLLPVRACLHSWTWCPPNQRYALRTTNYQLAVVCPSTLHISSHPPARSLCPPPPRPGALVLYSVSPCSHTQPHIHTLPAPHARARLFATSIFVSTPLLPARMPAGASIELCLPDLLVLWRVVLDPLSRLVIIRILIEVRSVEGILSRHVCTHAGLRKGASIVYRHVRRRSGLTLMVERNRGPGWLGQPAQVYNFYSK